MKFDLVASLKEFFFDIVGFFIPGFLVLVICKLILEVELDLEKNVYVTIIASYLIGYIIFSITLLKDKLINYFIKKTESSRTWFCIAFKAHRWDASEIYLVPAARMKISNIYSILINSFDLIEYFHLLSCSF